ncbi:MAG TPA: hypothetical protein VE987_20275 [Polyangiaceae bacterium]|nr:hypothetical protein [Polyangiaceae bacterium]
MLESSVTTSAPQRTILDRVADTLASLACTRVWVRGAGRHVLLGIAGQGAPFARVTALGGGSYGLAFQGNVDRRWEVLLVDDLRSVVEHALVGGGADV